MTYNTINFNNCLLSIRFVGLLVILLSVAIEPNPVAAQDTKIAGFADFQFGASDKSSDNSSFGLGQYDTYITSQLSERVSFLSEVVFEYDEGWLLDVERVVFKYNFDQFVQFRAGKHHTPIGYWNTAYHHGGLIQPTIQRPMSFLFEDEGGILPIHSTGVMLAGSDIGSHNFGYNVLVANGIGSTPTADDNDDKSYTIALRLDPLSGLTVGGSAYSDKISRGITTFQDTPLPESMTQTIFNGMVTYLPLSQSIELITEFTYLSNSIGATAATKTSDVYMYAGYGFNRITPYIRYESFDFASSEKYFVENDATQYLVGVRYDITYLSVVKLELSQTSTEIDGTVTQFRSQFSVGF